MFTNRLIRLMLVGTAGAALAGCSRTYGVSLGPADLTSRAEQYLRSEGYAQAHTQQQPGEVLALERQHGDSIDQVRFVRGGRSPGGGGGYMPMTTGSSGGVAGPQPAGGVSQIAASSYGGSYFPAMPMSAGSANGGLVLEVTSYRVDKNGKRHGIEPSDAFLAHADSVITLVTGIPSTMRK